MKKVLILIPTYNEADNIDELVSSIEQAAAGASGYAFSLLVIDDNSPDGTASHVKSLQDQYHNISLLSGRKTGLGRAYIRGFQYALEHGDYDAFIMMDADLSHNPADIPALLQGLKQGADYVVGSRYTAGGTVSGDWPFARVLASRMANMAARKLTGITADITDVTGGFKAIRGRALRSIDINSINARGYFFQVSLLHAFLAKGFRVREVPIAFNNRTYGASKLRTRDIIEFFYRAYKLNPQAPLQRTVRFCLVGAFGTVVNIAILTVLSKIAHIEILLSDALAIEGSILCNFFLNHTYTFKGYGSNVVQSTGMPFRKLIRKLGIYNAGMLVGALISFTTFTILLKLFHVQYILADAAAILIAMAWNYWVSVHFVWRSIDATDT